VITIDGADTRQWQAILDRCNTYDFYHMASYNVMEASPDGYQAILFVYEENEAVAALPLLLRPLGELDGLSRVFDGYFDATSVYGYPGPVTNRDWSDRAFFERFGHALHDKLQEMHVIAAFSRLHPIMKNDAGLCIGEVIPLGETVSINLRLPIDEQFRLFRKSHRYEIRKAQADNVIVVHDTGWKHYDDFIALYLATMRRVHADTQYYFDQAYFDQLRIAIGENLHLFAAKQDENVISAALFTLVNGLVEYHLSGSSTEMQNYAASKLVIDAARQWASAQGAGILHLGGGLGSRKDNLFLFKSGFSPQRHTFKVWQHIVDPTQYNLAVQQHQAWLSEHELPISQDDYFPSYRS
jgi:hypothetical protein